MTNARLTLIYPAVLLAIEVIKMNIKRLFSNNYLTWEEYKNLAFTTAFIDELSATLATEEIKKFYSGGQDGR